MSDSGFNLSFVDNKAQKKEEKKDSGSLFSQKPKEDPMKYVNDLSNQLHNFSRRLRVMEEGYINIRKKFQLTEQNMITNNKNQVSEIKTINSDIGELKSLIRDIKNEMILIIRELKLCAKTDEVKVLEKYINLWEPMNFVTHAELEKRLQEQKLN
jgi:ABC-type antimicrobial peptide transport system permease subunit